MADRNINVRLAGKQFGFTVKDQDQESLVRFAAEDINKTLGEFSAKYPDMSVQDKLSIIALNECVRSLARREELARMKGDEESLLRDIRNYLADIENSSR